MKQLTCEMCGSTDLMKQDGVFVCQTCGTKYSVEEAKKMMIEGIVEVTGTVKVDNTAAVDNYFNLARSAIESGNYKEAENYSNKIIELDPKNSSAWEIKGNAAGWQSNASNNRLGESMNAWLNAIDFASDDDLVELRCRVADEYAALFYAMIHLRAGNFANIQNAMNLKSTITDLDNGISIMNTLMVKGSVSLNRGSVYNTIAKELNDSAVDGFEDAKKDFAPEHSNITKWQLKNFIDTCDNCISMLEKALGYCKNRKLGKNICNNIIMISSLSPKSRNKLIEKYKERKTFFEEDQVELILKALQYNHEDIEIEMAKKAYWKDHAAEKLKLETEEHTLSCSITDNEDMLASLPISAEISSITKKIDNLIEHKLALGLFKFKDKKAIQEQIDELEQIRESQLSQEESEKKSIEDAIAQSEARIEEIGIELNKERGKLSVSADDIFLSGAIADGKFTITPQQLFDHLKEVLPSFFMYESLDEVSSSYDDFGYQVRLIDKSGVELYCTADNKNSPIRNIIIEGMKASIVNNDEKMNYGIVSSYVFMSLFKGMNQSEAEKTVLNIRFNADRSFGKRDGIRFEYASKPKDCLGIGVYVDYDAIIIRPILD